jgi:hypothetical protein
VVAPRVTTNLFSLLGARPLLGRAFTEAEGQQGGSPVVLLSEDQWRETFHADPNIVGRTVKVAGTSRTVVGVMPDPSLSRVHGDRHSQRASGCRCNRRRRC